MTAQWVPSVLSYLPSPHPPYPIPLSFPNHHLPSHCWVSIPEMRTCSLCSPGVCGWVGPSARSAAPSGPRRLDCEPNEAAKAPLAGPSQVPGGRRRCSPSTSVFVGLAEVRPLGCTRSRLLSPFFLTSACVNATRAALNTFGIPLKNINWSSFILPGLSRARAGLHIPSLPRYHQLLPGWEHRPGTLSSHARWLSRRGNAKLRGQRLCVLWHLVQMCQWKRSRVWNVEGQKLIHRKLSQPLGK